MAHRINRLRRFLNLDSFEDRTVPAVLVPDNAVLIGPDGGGIPKIKIVDPATGEDVGEIQAYEDAFRGGVNVAVGDVTGDGVRDVVIAPGSGGGPRIKILDGVSGKPLADFFVYEPNFRGGVTVALGDVNGDGKDDLITGTGKGGGPRVRVLDGATLGATVLKDYFAYESNFRGGVIVASGDLDGDGKDDIITGTGVTGGPRVSAVSGKDGHTLDDFFAYDNRFRGGVLVSAGDVNGDGKDDIITGTGPGGGAVIRTFSGIDGTNFTTQLVDDSTFRGGVRVGSDDLDGDGHHEVITRTRHGNQLTLRIFDGLTGAFERGVSRTVDDNPGADDGIANPGGTVTPGVASAVEGRITAINPMLGTVDLLLQNGSTVVVQAGPGTVIERNHAHTTLATFVVGEKGEALIGPDGIAWEIESRPFGVDEDHGGGGNNNGTVTGKVEGIITALNVAANQVTIRRQGGTTVTVTAAAGAEIERNDQHVTLSAFQIGDRGEALIRADGLAVKIEAETIPTGGGGGGTITGTAPPANSNIEGTITAVDTANNRITIRASGNVDYLVQVVNGTKVERNDVETSIGSFKVGDFGQAKTNANGLTFKLEAVGP